MLHRDLVQLLGTRQGSVTAHTRLMASHVELVSEYVRLLQPTTTGLVMIGRIDVEPGPHSNDSEYRETRVDRWMAKPGPLRPFRARAGWLLWPVNLVRVWANERGSHRFVVAFGPLVRIFLGTHIRSTALRIAKGYALLALTIDPCAADSPARAAWLTSARHDLELLASYLPTWRSLANALLGIPLISLLPTIMFTALGTDSIQGTIETYGKSLLTAWPLWLPTALYFLTAVSWSYAMKRRLLLGRATISKKGRQWAFHRTVYTLEDRVIRHLPLSRPRELALDLLFPAATYLFFACASAFVFFAGEPNARGEPPPITLLVQFAFLFGLSGSYLIPLFRRKAR